VASRCASLRSTRPKADIRDRRLRVYFVEKLSGDWPDFGAISMAGVVRSGVFRLFAGAVGLFDVLDRPFPLK
jgi:hypothetical protein